MDLFAILRTDVAPTNFKSVFSALTCFSGILDPEVQNVRMAFSGILLIFRKIYDRK
jgi:hypothetical protein